MLQEQTGSGSEALPKDKRDDRCFGRDDMHWAAYRMLPTRCHPSMQSDLHHP